MNLPIFSASTFFLWYVPNTKGDGIHWFSALISAWHRVKSEPPVNLKLIKARYGTWCMACMLHASAKMIPTMCVYIYGQGQKHNTSIHTHAHCITLHTFLVQFVKHGNLLPRVSITSPRSEGDHPRNFNHFPIQRNGEEVLLPIKHRQGSKLWRGDGSFLRRKQRFFSPKGGWEAEEGPGGCSCVLRLLSRKIESEPRNQKIRDRLQRKGCCVCGGFKWAQIKWDWRLGLSQSSFCTIGSQE